MLKKLACVSGLLAIVAWQAGCGGGASTAGTSLTAQTIAFPAPTTPVTYGAAAVTLGATASSSLPVTYSVTGPATQSAGKVTFTGTGTVTVTASQAGNTTYSAATPVTQSIVVAPAPLSVTANNYTIVLGQPLPAFSATLLGFVNGDTAATTVTGTPALTSNPVLTIPGIYPVIAAQGTLAASNYTFASFTNGTLTVQSAATVNGTLVIPPLLVPTIDGSGVKHFTMNMLKGSTSLLPGVSSTTEGFNGVWMAPTIEVNNGDQVAMAITNSLGEDTTVHFHGAHVPAIYDGGVFGVFSSGTTYTPSFTLNQQAATLWYHPHVIGNTARAIALGLAGEFIIGDSSSASAVLPDTYGINDIPLVLQQEAIANDGTIEYTESTIVPGANFPLFLNGMNVSTAPATLNTGQNRLRFRLLNASIGSQVTVSMSDQSAFTMIASDGGYLAAPLSVTGVTLGPAERAEIIVDLAPGATRTLVTAVAGVAPEFPSAAVSTLVIATTGVSTPATLPTTLNTITPYGTASAVSRTVTLTGTLGSFGIDGLDVLQLSQFAQTAIHSTLGNTEVWNIVNQTEFLHYFHMHGVQFQILSIGGSAPPAAEAGWKDTVAVAPFDTVQIVMQFLDYADANNAYMLHCHIVTHEDEGMMGAFYVDPD
jgi:FtsP/CotA-like multicopper oxidase with cupredoxin domain